MKPARAARPIDDAVDPRIVYLAEMAEMQDTLRQVQADAFRLIVASVARGEPSGETVAALDETTAKITRLENDNVLLRVAITAERLKDHGARTVRKWLDAEQAGFRFGLSAERMRQLEKQCGVFVTRRVGRRIQFLTASIDERLRWLGREPRLTREEERTEARAKAKAAP